MNLSAFKTIVNARNLFTILVMTSVWSAVEAPFVLAQVTTAITPTTGVGDLGTKVIPDGNTFKVTGGTRLNNGMNLFHSFDQFSVGRGDTAQFLNTTPSISTSNIMNRVTGGNPSSIFGTIDTTSYPSANLFLMNPAGIIFGPTATLNVGGSVAFTTADYLRLAEGNGSNAGIFHADTALPNLLTSSPVAAFGFLGSNPAAIAIQGSTLIVPPDQSISIVGGNRGFNNGNASAPNGVTVTGGHLSASGGQIKIAGIASSGELLAENLDKTANIKEQSFGTLGTIQVSKRSDIDTSGENGGRILVKGGRLLVDDSWIFANTKAPKSGAARRPDPSWLSIGIEIQMAQDAIVSNGSVIETNVKPGADHSSHGISVTADHIEISGGPKILKALRTNPESPAPFAGLRSNVDSKSTTANSGTISLNANSVHIKNLGKVETKTVSAGSAGHINLIGSESIAMDSFAFVGSQSSESSGQTGNISVISRQGNVSITTGTITTQAINSSGNTGNISLTAPQGDIHLESGEVFTSSQGDGAVGSIQIAANNLFLVNEASISGNNFTTQVAGNISLEIKERLSLTGDSLIQTATPGSTNAADLIIKSHDTVLTEGSRFVTSTISSGDAGRLSLFTDILQLTEGGRLSSRSILVPGSQTPPSGRGGVINVDGYRSPGTSITIDGAGSGIFTSAQGTGAAGGIVVKASSVTLQNGGTMSAETTGTSPKATGGSITITATDQISLNNSASITASTSGPGSAGSILVKANDITIGGGSTITASSTGSGNAGTVTIQGLQSPARSFLIDGISSGVFTKTSDTGAGGNLSVSSDSILIQNKGSVSGETSGTSATATGGTIGLDGNQIRIEGGALVTSSSTGPGSGGDITLKAEQSVTIKDGATVSASSTGPGAAGNVEINAGKQLDVERGSITTQSNQLNGGDIKILASDLLRVVDGKISTSALNGLGNGGNITIDPKVVLLQTSEILAQAKDGNGGSINISTPMYLKDQSSLVNADSEFGVNGTVTIQSPISNVSGTVGQLVSKTSPPQVLLQNRCVALAGGEQSTFLLSGRDALPVEPGGWLNSPVSVEHWTEEETEHASGLMVLNRGFTASPTVASQKNTAPGLSLRRLTPPGFLVRTFATGPTGCPS